MADFNQFFPTLLKFEGGYVNDPADPGGATNKGVTLLTFKRFAEPLLKIEPTLENLKNITDEQAGVIYKHEYWDKIHGDDIDFQPLADIIFDFYVNAGSHATKLLQSKLNTFGAHLHVDGAIGPASLNAMKHVDSKALYKRYKAGRIAYYEHLVAVHPVLKKFLHGWLKRVNAFPDV